MKVKEFKKALLNRGFKQNSEHEFEKNIHRAKLYVTKIDYEYYAGVELPPNSREYRFEDLSFSFYNEYEKVLQFLKIVEKIRSNNYKQ